MPASRRPSDPADTTVDAHRDDRFGTDRAARGAAIARDTASTSFAIGLLARLTTAAAPFEVAPVAAFHLPPTLPDSPDRPRPGPGRLCNHFAALQLADGTIGMTYTAIDGVLAGLQQALPTFPLAGRPARDIAQLYREGPGWRRALGLAAINAISQVVLRARGAAMAPCPDTVSLLDVRPGDAIGMVGLFGRLIEPIRRRGASLTVVELDAAKPRQEAGLTVTLDTGALSGCNKILITGTTLLNGTLDAWLARLAHAEQICLIGPTAGCLPDGLFERGLTAIGGTRIDSIDRFLPLWADGGRWREAGTRYLIHRDGYRC